MHLVIPVGWRCCGANGLRVWSQVCSVSQSGGLPAENVCYKWFSSFSGAITGFFSPTIDSALTSGFLRFVLCSTRDNSLSVPAGSHWQGFRINYFGRKNNCQRAAATAASTFHSHFCKFLPSLLTPYWHCMKQRAGRLPFSFWERLFAIWLPFHFRSNLFLSLWAR